MSLIKNDINSSEESKKKNPITEEIASILEKKRLDEGLTQAEFSKKYGINGPTYQSWLRKAPTLNDKTIKHLSDTFDDVKMIFDNIKRKTRSYLPLVDTDIQGANILDNDNIYSTTQISIQNFNECDMAIKNYDTSLRPEIEAGDILIIKKVEARNYMNWGQKYVLITPDYVFVRIIKEAKDKSYILSATSPNIADIELPIADIKSIYLIKGCIKKYTL